MSKDKPASALKSVGLVMLLSAAARGLSLVGSMRYTAWFGYTLETDIYSFAVNLPNLIFTCIGTALVTVVIPIFAGRLASGDSDRAYFFIDNVLSVSLIIAAFISAAGIFAAPLIVRMIGKFYEGGPALATFAIRLMFPIMLFHAVSYILQGVMQTNRRYLLPASISAFSGLSIILYIAFFADRFGIRGLLVATFAGLAIQAIILIPPVINKLKYKYRPRFRLRDDDMRLAGRLALPVLVSSSSYQFNMFMNSTFAARFDGGVLTITNMLTLAFTAAQLFIISTLAVYFPRMSAKYATGDVDGFRGEYGSVTRLIVMFAVPASAALAYLSRLIIPLLYGHGKVTASDMATSAAVFAIYAAAIASIGFKEAADRAFYAIRDSRTPAAVSVVIMAINIALSLILMNTVGLIGLPVAYFTSITTGAVILLLLLRTKMKMKGAADTDAEMLTRKDADTGAAALVRKDADTGAAALTLKCAVATCVMLATLFAVETALNAILPSFFGALAGTRTVAPYVSAEPATHLSIPSFLSAAVSKVLTTTAYGLSTIEQIIRLAVLGVTGAGAYFTAALGLGLRFTQFRDKRSPQ